MSRLYILILPKGVGWCILAALGVVILLALYHNYPLGLHALSLLHQEIVYDVMLDAGHGGIDPGAIGAGELYEKDYVLDIVLQMAAILESRGLKVGLTRDSDPDVSHLVSEGTRHRRDLLGRFKLMNQAQVGMSVHANAAKDSSEAGAIVFFMKDSYLGQPTPSWSWKSWRRCRCSMKRAPIPRSTLLLLKARPPVVLVEVGFMSNPADLAKLGNPQFRSALAKGSARQSCIFGSGAMLSSQSWALQPLQQP